MRKFKSRLFSEFCLRFNNIKYLMKITFISLLSIFIVIIIYQNKLTANKLVESNQQILNKEEEIKQLKQVILDYEDQLTKHEQTISEMTSNIKEYEEKILQLESTISELQAEVEKKNSFLGEFNVSFYTPTDGSATGITATGNQAIPYYTVAVDPNVIPLGTKLYIENFGEVIADDTGGAIKGMRLDFCVSSVEEAYRYGVQNLKVWIVE